MAHHPLARRLLSAVAGASLIVAGGLTATGSGATGGGPQAPADGQAAGSRIDQAVAQELAADGSADFWVYFTDRADLSEAASIEDWNARGQAVYDELVSTAEHSQAQVRADLDAAGVDYQAFYISNAIRVSDGSPELATALAAEPAVAHLYPTVTVEQPVEQVELAPEATPQAIEWGVGDINADDVWATGVTGQGIVVASIDTGVQWNHPALINRYRGKSSSGVNHNYNWFNAGHGTPNAPSDTNGHGTHVTGTMVGTDGGANQIGVAPGARWIAANGCCPNDAALMASGEWMLAPKNLAGTKPRPDLRPHIINNSWSSQSPSNEPFMEDISLAWAASGQFAVFANGNNAPGCHTSGSPGSRTINYSVGNYTKSHVIAYDSSRGAGQNGTIKPDISAPGTDVRSAYPGNSYVRMSGTSMASPHVAGSVALLWSAHSALIGDITTTRKLLDRTAIDTSNLACGGTEANNNVFGEGRLDVKALIETGPQVQRLAGEDRYATAAAVSKATYPAGAGTVYLATGVSYPDALVGAALAGSNAGPVLLTRPGALPATTRTELARLAPTRVVIFGGAGSVSQEVRNEVVQLTGASVSRLSGTDRYETAAQIAAQFPASQTVYVATGATFPDALAGAARAGALDAPVLLTQKDTLPEATRAQLARLQPTSIRVLGGTSTVSDSVQTQLAAYGPVTRISGQDRYDTAVRISKGYAPPTNVFLATGLDWPDALAGAAAAGAGHNPVLLVRGGSIPPSTWGELDRLNPATVTVLGGPSSVPTQVEAKLYTLTP